jgi:hypothetical protein
MTLGELLGEVHGKVTGLGALENGRIEVSLECGGKLLGSDIADVTPFWSEIRPKGTAYGEGYSVPMSSECKSFNHFVVSAACYN